MHASKHKRGRTKAAMKNPETNCACLFAFRGLEYVHAYIQASKQRGGCKRVATGMELGQGLGFGERIRVWRLHSVPFVFVAHCCD